MFLHPINRRVYKFVGEWPSRRATPLPTQTPPLNGNIQAIRKAHTATGFSGEPPSAAGLPLSIDTLRGRSLIFKVKNLSCQAETSREPESGE